MITTVLTPQPVSLTTKVELTAEKAQRTMGSEFNATDLTPWLGDQITTNSLFPQWILKAYDADPDNIMIVPIVKQYFRWLLSQEYGYGAQLNWENIRVPLFINDIFLEALADYYFPNADFSSDILNSVLPNIKKFLINSDLNYFNIKGTPTAIKYLICTLLGFDWDDVYVFTSNYVTVEIRISSSVASNLEPYKSFLISHVIPAGMVVTYTTI